MKSNKIRRNTRGAARKSFNKARTQAFERTRSMENIPKELACQLRTFRPRSRFRL